MPFLNELMSLPVSLGIGVIGKTIFLNSRSILPDDMTNAIITVIEYGGMSALRVHNGKAIARPSANVMARHDSYPVARAKLQEVFDSLGGDDGLHNIFINGVFYVSIVPRQSFIDVGTDDKGRARVAFNVDVEKEPS